MDVHRLSQRDDKIPQMDEHRLDKDDNKNSPSPQKNGENTSTEILQVPRRKEKILQLKFSKFPEGRRKFFNKNTLSPHKDEENTSTIETNKENINKIYLI